MSEPTRDALHAETLHYLEFQRDDKLRIDANRTAMGMVPSPAWKRDAELYEYAAECVKRVPELEAEVERLRAVMYDATLSLSNHPCGEAGCVASLDAIHTALRHAAGLGWVVVDEAGNLRYSTRSRAAADLFARRGGWKVTYAAATREGTSDGN